MYSTRRISVEDVPRVVELLEQLHNNSRYAYLTFDAPKMIQLLSASAFSDDMITVVCIDHNDTVIGAIGGIVSQPGFAKELLAYKQFFVLDQTRRGFLQARLLLAAFETWARSRSAVMCNLFIDYSHDDERVAQFCKRAGYVQQGIALTKEIR